jgi:hypothetical protein
VATRPLPIPNYDFGASTVCIVAMKDHALIM